MRELMAKYNTDKGDKGFGHAYYRQYEKLFAPFRTSRVRLLEIGVDGGNSMGLWKEYFPNAELLAGVGYGDRFDDESIRRCADVGVRCYRGDQANGTFLKELVRRTGGRFDIIVDDGSHVPEHQFITMKRLLNTDALNDGGLYIVEDVETSYWKPGSSIYGYALTGTGLHGRCSFVEYAKRTVDIVNRRFLRHRPIMSTRIERRIESVEFAQDIVIFKIAHPESLERMNTGNYWSVHDEDPARIADGLCSVQPHK